MLTLIRINSPRLPDGFGWREGYADRPEKGMVQVTTNGGNVLFHGGDELFSLELSKGRIECDEEELDAFYNHGQED